ncbi:MAG: hypothetical protein IH987_15910 [Planctomycetes bacterium]|nr:hypothetical protein [Planctomycetota bacterium]
MLERKRMKFSLTLSVLILACGALGHASANAAEEHSDSSLPRIALFTSVSNIAGTQILEIDDSFLSNARSQRGRFVVEGFPVSPHHTFDLELERFFVTSPRTRVVLGRRNGPDVPIEFSYDRFTLLRGRVLGSPGSDVFLALSDQLSTGHIVPVPGGPVYQVSGKDQADKSLAPGMISVFRRTSGGGAPPDVLR